MKAIKFIFLWVAKYIQFPFCRSRTKLLFTISKFSVKSGQTQFTQFTAVVDVYIALQWLNHKSTHINVSVVTVQ